MFNSIEDRALSEHRGSALLMKKENGKYSILLPVEGTGENGSTPAQLDKTAIGNAQATSVEGRTENPQKTIPFYTHRDNINILENIAGENHDFLRLLPDFTGFKYSGSVSYMANNTDVGSLEQGQLTITPTTKDEYVENCFDLVEDTVVFTSSIDEVVTVVGTGTKVINVTTNPSDATISAASDTEGTATASVSEKAVTITGVKAGSAIITITATKSGYASFKRTVLVIVKSA
ncbi:hypothetical protein [Megamonas funiformis]|jgi:hypothetical protein|uniref:hypothetical protein n=1 Tax=Megamonas funiformis TaxID=437897 RepID=UPI003F7E9093